MSPSVFAAVVGPVTGSAASTRGGKADARSVGDGDFASVLNEVPANDAPPQPTPTRADKSRDAASVESESAATDASAAEIAAPDAVQAEVVPVAEAPLGVPAFPVTGVTPSAQVPLIASEAVEADGSAGVASPSPTVPEGQGDADAAAGSLMGEGEEPDRAASILAKDSAPALKADLAARAEQAASTKADASQGQSESVQADEPVVPAGPKVVTPPASDRARDVAAVNSAVVTPVRPAKAASTPTPEPTAASVESSDASSGEGDVPPPVAPAPALVEPSRVRDVIDRAVAGTTSDASSSEAEASSSGATKSPDAGGSSATAAAPKPASPIEVAAPPVAAAAVMEEPPATPSGASAQPAPEAAATEAAQTPVLSTLSRASIETTAQIAAQITRKLEGRSTRFEMALTPEGLGRVDISLDIEADGALRATLAFDNPVAATELRGRVDELRRQLTDAGFTLADDALSFAERDPSAGQGGAFDRPSDRHNNARAFGVASRLSAEADVSAQAPRWVHLSLTPTGVDMKV